MAEPTLLEEGVQIASAGAGVGGGIYALRWVVGWLTARFDRRQAVLDAQEAKVDLDWQAIRGELKADNAEMKRRLDQVEKQNRLLHLSFQHVAGALVRIDPTNPALLQAEQMLAQAFPLDLSLLTEMAEIAFARSQPAPPAP